MRRVGLFVGIDRYQNGITPLQCAVSDAYALTVAFARAQFDSVKLLLNEEADYDTILDTVKNLVNDLGPGDLFVFYFSGHGREINGVYYLAGVNSDAGDALYTIDAIPIPTLISLTDKPGLNRLFILDCCRSNILADQSGVFVCEDSRDIALNKAIQQSEIASIIPPLILNSCGLGEQAFENVPEKHGYFTKALLDSINNISVNSFSSFRNSLKITGTPKPQNTSWNGNIAHWENIPLFNHWSSAASQPPQTVQPPPFEYYELSIEEYWELSFSDEMQRYEAEEARRAIEEIERRIAEEPVEHSYRIAEKSVTYNNRIAEKSVTYNNRIAEKSVTYKPECSIRRAEESCDSSKAGSIFNNQKESSFIKKIISLISALPWCNKPEIVYSSIFAPAEITQEKHLLVQVYFHLYEETETVISLADESDKKSKRRGYLPLSLKLKKGDKIDIEFNVYGKTHLMSRRKSIIWHPPFTKCSFDYFVPGDIDVNELSCEANIFVNGAMIGEMRFITKIVGMPRKLNPMILSRRFNKIFISYAHKDARQVRFLALAYKAQGIDYFYDRDSLALGDVYNEKIFDYIDSSDLFILCWSKNAAESSYVAREKKRAMLRAYPQCSIEDATLKICPISIKPRAELPNDMKHIYNFEEI